MSGEIPHPPAALAAALLGADYPGLRIRAEVAEGDRVAPGQILFRDARRPQIAFASPIRGRVAAIRLAARRMLASIEVRPADGGPAEPEGRLAPGETIRAHIQSRGLWPAFVTRPFGGPPDPEAHPHALLVSAVASGPHAPDPDAVLAARMDDFGQGLAALRALTDAPIHLCLGRTSRLAVPDIAGLHIHRRSGRRWASPAAQVARVAPAAPDRPTWTVLYQDVVAIGHLLATGRYDPIRRIGLRPPGHGAGRLVDAPLGADLYALLGAANDALDPFSGPPRSGRFGGYLGRHHLEAGLSLQPRRRIGAALHPIVPFAALGRALPVRLPAVPLMRSLLAGDVETCARLGCLQLLEDDIAPLNAICASGADYPSRLRVVLDRLRSDLA